MTHKLYHYKILEIPIMEALLIINNNNKLVKQVDLMEVFIKQLTTVQTKYNIVKLIKIRVYYKRLGKICQINKA